MICTATTPATNHCTIAPSVPRRKTERVFAEHLVPEATTIEKQGNPLAMHPVSIDTTSNNVARVAGNARAICGACGSNLEDDMCFNCGAKTCRKCGFANTGSDLEKCSNCGNLT
ncbi:MAG: hypothetical protein GYA24_19665 [Candidatus Lokiarchaeota archaeon]|nr:hypothetical protein [Candidatus Lokiarchaeota archaeon]